MNFIGTEISFVNRYTFPCGLEISNLVSWPSVIRDDKTRVAFCVVCFSVGFIDYRFHRFTVSFLAISVKSS